MAISDFSPFRRDMKGRAMEPPPTGKRADKSMGTVREKPAHPSADLPGKSQPRDRSMGVRRATGHPKSRGL